jgi:hypothetical protein
MPAVPLSWLGGTVPAAPSGVSWGVPWPRGAMPAHPVVVVRTAEGQAIPTQCWPLAYWPDGSAKWTGLAIAAEAHLAGPLTVTNGASPAPQFPVAVTEGPESVEISTGPMTCRIARHGSHLIDSLVVAGREVGRAGRLVAIREDRSRFEAEGIVREINYTSSVTQVTVEQSGPVRAVVRIEGMHSGGSPARSWLPFTVRLYFTAGLTSVRAVHSFVYDGDAKTDFIRGLGIAFTVPFREERQNRHIRFAGEAKGFWGEPVLMSPGYVGRGKNAEMNRDQLVGKRIPSLEQMDARAKAQFGTIALWDDFKLSQLSPDSFSIDKRTNAASSWLHIGNGHRAGGFAFVGDVSGGLAVGVKRFWEKYPSQLEVEGAAQAAAELTVWFWSPDAPPMDLRHYDTIGHNGASYEDHQDGFSTPYGVANTSELTLWGLGSTPDNVTLGSMEQMANEPPLLVCSPAYYHATHVLGAWSLPDRSTPEKAAMEAELERAFQFFHHEVEMRHWYGFWDYGDFMRTYDPRRHQWMYDIGGHAWNNTELMPNLWLWYSFLRTGRADYFRVAEAMTRNTGEVDVYHLGPFFGLGSRHNVSHWGDGAKEARISEAPLKRFYYYLTTDERTGDLMREVLQVDQTIARIQPLRHQLVRPDEPVIFRLTPDWEAMAGNWMTEWERTGNGVYRDYLRNGMKSIAALPGGIDAHNGFHFDPQTKRLTDIGEPNQKGGYFMYLFGGDELGSELIQLIDCPEFAAAWIKMADKVAKAEAAPASYYAPRITAYAAYAEHDAQLGHKAWDDLRRFLRTRDVRDRFPEHPASIADASVPYPVQEIPIVDTPGTSQWCLNLIVAPEWAKDYYVPPAANHPESGPRK